jgi:dUTP pyrophosphatase
MKVKIKKLHENAVIPKYSTDGSAAMDIVATTKTWDEFGNVVYGTGLAIEIPEGYVAMLFPRSSNSKTDLLLANSVGIIDSDYRGELIFKYKPIFHNRIISHQIGDRIGQIMIVPYPKIEFQEVGELSETERGSGGFGSTGK